MNRYIFFLFMIIGQSLFGVGVPAGTEVINVAQLNYKMGEVEFSAQSNKLIDIVDQKLDMKMVCQESNPVVVGVGEEKRAMSFILNNTGNGVDTYIFSAIEGETLDFSVSNEEIYLDNGDGLFSLSEDTLVTELDVPADSNVTLFLVSDIPSDADKFSSNGIEASSVIQGSLLYGESKKLDNFYAVMATKEDDKSDVCTYEVSHLAVKLEKSATLSSDKVYLGSTIHYSIAVKLVGEGTINDIVVNDNIPVGTTYVPDSLKLDGVAAGDFNGTAISVALASMTQNTQDSDTEHQISFDVRVQ